MTVLLDYLRFLVANILYVLITVVIAAAIGFGAGWYIHGKFYATEQLVAVKNTTVADAQSEVESQRRGEILSTSQYQTQVALDHARQQLQNSPIIVVQPEPVSSGVLEIHHNDQPPAPPPAPGLDRLSVYGVGVLNHALDPTAPDPDGWSDETKRTASENGLREVSDHIVKVASVCRALGERHDTLVDDVERFQKTQIKTRSN